MVCFKVISRHLRERIEEGHVKPKFMATGPGSPKQAEVIIAKSSEVNICHYICGDGGHLTDS